MSNADDFKPRNRPRIVTSEYGEPKAPPFYCVRYCGMNLPPGKFDQSKPNCIVQCEDCACDVGERRIKTKVLMSKA